MLHFFRLDSLGGGHGLGFGSNRGPVVASTPRAVVQSRVTEELQ